MSSVLHDAVAGGMIGLGIAILMTDRVRERKLRRAAEKQPPAAASPAEARDLGDPTSTAVPDPGTQQTAHPTGRSLGKTIRMTIGAIILAMGVVWAFTGGDQDRSGASTLPLEVGECVTAAQYDDPSLVHEPVPCGTPEALYSLAYRGGAGDTCPDGAVGNESAYMAIRGTSVLYCFVLDVTEGECLNVQASKVRPVACTDVFANLRIGQILNDKTEPASCPDGNGFSWPQPARTVCFAPL